MNWRKGSSNFEILSSGGLIKLPEEGNPSNFLTSDQSFPVNSLVAVRMGPTSFRLGYVI